MQFMRKIAPRPDFILAGGDHFGHIPKSNEGPAAVRSAAVLLASLLHKSFPHTPTLHTIGNHDTWPEYSRAAAWHEWEEAWRADVHLGDAYVAAQFPDDALSLWRSGGYYARTLWQQPQHHNAQQQQQPHEDPPRGATPRAKLWGISLNTNDLALAGGAEQLTWLAKTLSALRAAGDTAILLGQA